MVWVELRSCFLTFLATPVCSVLLKPVWQSSSPAVSSNWETLLANKHPAVFLPAIPYQWKWAFRCDGGPLVRKIFDKNRRLYLVLHSWTDISGTAPFSEWGLGQHWLKQCLIHWHAGAYLFIMHFNTLEGGIMHLNWHWFYWRQGSFWHLLRENTLVAPPPPKPCQATQYTMAWCKT